MVRVGFSTNPKNLLSRIIRWATDSKVSHTFFIVDWCGSEVIVEAHWNGFRVLDFKQWKRDKPGQLVAIVEPSDDLTPGFEALIPYLGQPYDFGGLVGMACVLFCWRFLKRKVANPWDSHKALFCSEAVAQVLSWVSYPNWRKLPPENVSPDDILEFFLEQPGAVIRDCSKKSEG